MAARPLALLSALLLGLLGCERARLRLTALAAPGEGAAAAAPARPEGFQRGVSLGLFSEDPLWSYGDLLREIKALGATHVELVVAYYQRDGKSTEIIEHPRFTAPVAAVVRTIDQAQELGLKVLLFPIVRLSDPAPGEWRGTLQPADRAAWWRSYRSLMRNVAGLAALTRVDLLSVGSELSTLDEDRRPWEELVKEVRARYAGPLTYSGNWDHFERVGLYDLVDSMGVCGYFSLSGRLSPRPAEQAQMAERWRARRAELLAKARAVGRPLLFTEVGYLSQRGASAWPWEEGAAEPVDLEDQRRAYAAFREVWGAEPQLLGAYFWNWYGWGGPGSRGYIPRGKPAEQEIRLFFQDPPRAPLAR